jgi:hypothetical protein
MKYDFNHETFCDSVNNISKSCNCIVGYPLEIIENLEKQISLLERKGKIADELTEYYSDKTIYEVGSGQSNFSCEFGEIIEHESYAIFDDRGKLAQTKIEELDQINKELKDLKGEI